MTKILLIGPTGMIGSRVAAEARSRGHHVTEVTRSGGDDRIAADATDVAALAEAAAGHDAIISAISPPRDGTDPAPPLLDAGRSVMTAARNAGVGRVLIVGGAGSLLLDDGTRVVDQESFPEMVRPEALAQSDLLDLFRRDADDLDWSYLSPAGHIEPGSRTGTFTLGLDQLVTDAEGASTITAEDYAVALLDELESGAHIRQRFTAAYT